VRRGRRLKAAALLGLGLPAAALVALAATGRDARSYETLAPGGTVEVEGRAIRLADLAERHCPRFLIDPDHASPPLVEVLWEALPRGEGSLALVYRHVWTDERHPWAALHPAYAAYRAAKYGSVRDIEAFTVEVALAAGTVERLLFEGPDGPTFHAPFVRHVPVVVERPPLGPDGRPLVLVATWNHLVRLAGQDEARAARALEAPLRPLDDDAYARFKMQRRSGPP